MLCILRELLRNSGGLCCVSCNIREIPSEMEFHGLQGNLQTAIETRMTGGAME